MSSDYRVGGREGGVPLVVTEFVDGVVITTDWKAHGLNDFGRPKGFNARHLRPGLRGAAV